MVTFDHDHRVIDDGVVYIGDDGRIVDVSNASDAPPDGFAGVKRVVAGGDILPGLIDMHNHLPYNTISLWIEDAHPEPYTDHNQWTTQAHGPSYHSDVSGPGQFLGWVSGPSLMAYVEMKAMLGGTTTIQGNGKVNRAVEGSLARNIDTEKFGTTKDFFRGTTLVKSKDEELDEYRTAIEQQAAGFIYHVAEGTDPKLWQEFDLVDGKNPPHPEERSTSLVGPGFVAIHGTALDEKRLHRMGQGKATLVWSPFSNMWLYGRTADIATAKAEGIRICLGSDWSPSGTKHVLGELKVAKLWNEHPKSWSGTGPDDGPVFSDQELCDMVTANPGDTITEVSRAVLAKAKLPAPAGEVGRLEPGWLADLIVVTKRESDPYANLIEATEKDVQLVVVQGEPRLGTNAMMKKVGAAPNTEIDVGSLKRAVLLRNPANGDPMTWAAVLDRLEAVRAKPEAAAKELALALARAGGLDDPAAPFIVIGDMPLGESLDLGVAGRNDPPKAVPIPPLDSLRHDAAFLKRVDEHTYHRGLLSGLRRFYG
ncbi:MAG: amidohydrolase family protein [Acidimicrobiales bacterium]